MTRVLKDLAEELERRQSLVEQELKNLADEIARNRDSVSLKVFTYFVMLLLAGVFGVSAIRNFFAVP